MAKGRTERLSVALHPDVHARIKDAAAEFGVSVSAWSAFVLGQAAAQQANTREVLVAAATAALGQSLEQIEGEAVKHGITETAE